MKSNDEITRLECSEGRFYGPRRGSYRSFEPVPWKIAPVHGLCTAFILSLPLKELGLINIAPDKPLREAAAEKWERSSDVLFKEFAGFGITQKSIASREVGLSRVVIGWEFDPQNRDRNLAFGWCSDLELTLAVLSRCVGSIYFSDRTPDFSWDVLFNTGFLVDEDIQGGNIPTKFWQSS